MLSQCSSLNAVGWYVPLLYSSALATERLQLHPLAKPFCCGLFCLAYNLGYELNGASHQWWFWADGLQLYAPMWTLPGGTAHILDMGERVSAALEERWMRMPLMAPAFSAALGFGLCFGASLADAVLNLRPKRSAGWLVGFVSKVRGGGWGGGGRERRGEENWVCGGGGGAEGGEANKQGLGGHYLPDSNLRPLSDSPEHFHRGRTKKIKHGIR